VIKKAKLIGTTSASALCGSGFLTIFTGGMALLLAPPAQAQNACTILPGNIVNCLAGDGVIDLTGVTGPLGVTLNDGVTLVDTLTLGTIGAGDIVVDALGTADIESADGPGIVADAAQGIDIGISNITTVADGGIGALLTAVDEVIFTADGVISTAGDLADGVNIEGSTVSVDLNTVTTEGEESDGVEIISLVGPVNLDADLIDVAGGLSRATVIESADDINVSVRALRTRGTDGIALDLSSNPALCAVAGDNSCDVTAAADSITTEGFGGIGALVRAIGDTNIDVGVLRTGGDEAAGLDLGVNDLDACVLLGVGGCDTAFTVGELTTTGARAPGALVRAAGDITADVGVLRTSGDEAVGLDLGFEPDACVLIGAGGCDTSFTLGELTTSGAGATGVLVRAAGDTTGDIGILRTEGEDAVGVDIGADPAACILLGAGACDVGLIADEISTQGDGAAAVIIDAVGDVATDLGLLSTSGDGATALGIILDPTLCLALGPGACAVQAAVDDVETDGDDSPGIEVDGGEDPIEIDAGEVSTGGDNSPGIDVVGSGPIDIDVGTVDTGGDASPGIIVDGDDDPITIVFDDVTTGGDGSPGIDVSGEGEIDVSGGTVTTGGAGSDGIVVDGGDGTVSVDVGGIVTTGPDSDGIDVETDAGDQVIIAGPIDVRGAGSDGIVANSTGCGDISITARDDIRSAQGTALVAATACAVSVTTLPGATVSGAVAGIDVTSGTGSTITIGDNVTATAGPAIDADGGAASVIVTPTGSITGRVDLTDAADTLTNNGTFTASGTSDFGAAADLLTNNRTLAARGDVVLANLETLVNNGSVTMVDGAADDTLTISGDYTGGPGAQLALDVAAGVEGTPTDRLIVGGAASGSTEILLNPIGAGVVNADGTVIVDAGTAAAGAFTLGGETSAGFVDFSLGTNATGDTLLFALPNDRAIEPALLPQIGQVFWYQSADAVTQSLAHRRGNIGSGGTHFWLQGYGGTQDLGDSSTLDVFGSAREADLNYDFDYKGVQAGVDFGGESTVFGLTGGYELADVDFASGSESEVAGYNIGAYVLHGPPSGFYAQGLAKVDFFEIGIDNGVPGFTDIEGKSYGAEAELGYRTSMGSFSVDFGAGLAWVKTDIDDAEGGGAVFSYDDAESLRGKAGVRFASTASGMGPYLDLKAFHEFNGENGGTFSSGGFDLPLLDPGRGTWGRAELGLAGSTNSAGASGFVAAWGEFGDVKGYGLRAGIRF
jgi:outer membrane autotransporter protein